MREYSIAVIEGDGIGPEIVREAVSVLEAAGRKYGFHLNLTPVLLGGASIDRYGVPLTQETIEIAKKSDAVRRLPGTDWSLPNDRKQDCSASARRSDCLQTSGRRGCTMS